VIEHSRPERAWPKYGAIKFDNVNVRYREELAQVVYSYNISTFIIMKKNVFSLKCRDAVLL